MVKKKDQKKMDLSAFLADESTGLDWADEMNSLPTAPATRDESDPTAGMRRPDRGDRPPRDRGFDRDRGDRDRDRDRERPQREHHEVPLPDKPPFTAYVGNLGFDSREPDLEEWISEGEEGKLNVVSVRFVRAPDEKLKGFGYVEFGSLSDLKAALKKDGSQFGGRLLKISVAEPPKERVESRSSGDRWERTGPLPPLASSSRQSSLRNQVPSEDTDRGERMGFGSKFVPSTDLPPRGGSGGGFSRSTSERGMARNSSFRREEEGDRGERMGFGSKFVPSNADEDRRDRRDRESSSGGRDFGGNWRTGGGGHNDLRRTASGFGSDRGTGGGSLASPTLERRKLDLTPRSIPNSPAESSAQLSASVEPKPSPFGAAKPIDTSAREREIEVRREEEAKLKKEEEEKKKASSPFGAAKPIDVSAREREIEEKRERERKERSQRPREDRPAEREERTPTIGGKFVPSSQQSPTSSERGFGNRNDRRSQSGFQRTSSNQGSSRQSPPHQNHPNQSQRSTNAPKPQSFRKEGFSYSTMARSTQSDAGASKEGGDTEGGENADDGLNGVEEEMGGMKIDV